MALVAYYATPLVPADEGSKHSKRGSACSNGRRISSFSRSASEEDKSASDESRVEIRDWHGEASACKGSGSLLAIAKKKSNRKVALATYLPILVHAEHASERDC